MYKKQAAAAGGFVVLCGIFYEICGAAGTYELSAEYSHEGIRWRMGSDACTPWLGTAVHEAGWIRF